MTMRVRMPTKMLKSSDCGSGKYGLKKEHTDMTYRVGEANRVRDEEGCQTDHDEGKDELKDSYSEEAFRHGHNMVIRHDR